MSEKKFIIKDSGQRQEFETGSRRDTNEGKGRFDLIPTLPIRRLAIHYENGAKKYGDNNWQKGQPLMRYVESMERHVNCLKAGEPTEDHAIAAVWNLFAYIWTLNEIEHGRLPKALDNRPPPEPQYDPALKKIDDVEELRGKFKSIIRDMSPEQARAAIAVWLKYVDPDNDPFFKQWQEIKEVHGSLVRTEETAPPTAPTQS